MKRRPSIYSRMMYVLAAAVFMAVFFGLAAQNAPQSIAVKAVDFKAGRIIDDEIFYNPNTMTVEQIQAHLDQYSASCDMWGTQAIGYGRKINGVAVNPNITRRQYAQMMRNAGRSDYHDAPYVCISKFYENPTTHKTNFDTNAEPEEGMISAAQIIYEAAHKYSINPQVLLVMLKKESYVWGDTWPLKNEYNTVMGYACPDGAPCNSAYFGFYNQVMKAAWQLKYYKDHIYSYGYYPYMTNNILYSPDRSCGSKAVYIENIATTSLYIYTPYTPNDAALANYPGTATCGSYGNRNFFMFFSEWFGTTYVTQTPNPTPEEPKAEEPTEPEEPKTEEPKEEPKPEEPKPEEPKKLTVEEVFSKMEKVDSVKTDLPFKVQVSVDKLGLLDWIKGGEMVGTTGFALRTESIAIKLDGDKVGVKYRTHMESKGWESGYKKDGEVSGSTEGEHLRMEAIQIDLYGDLADKYDIYYRAHVQNVGWQSWVKNGETAGTTGKGQRIEALQIKIVSRIRYKAHVQNVGWQDEVKSGETAGTSGKGWRMEALVINSDSIKGITYRAHVQNIGWQNWVKAGDEIGTTGKGWRMEAIEIKLPADAAKKYDIYYRAHVQNIGWQNWVKNGATAGTTGLGRRIEALEIKILRKE